MNIQVGLDIGGTKMLAAAADADRNIIARAKRPTPLDLAEGLADLHEMVAEVTGKNSLEAIGASVGGPLDWWTGVVSPLHQPRWREVPLREIFEKRWQCPFAVDVDTSVAALAEYEAICALGRQPGPPDRLLYMPWSTGIGGGLIVDGEIYRGADGAHPEIGHQAVNYRCSNPAAIQCECGVPDCLEALASGNGIRRVYGKSPEELTDDEWAEVAYNLVQGLRNLAVIYLPDVIVLGGGIAIGRGQQLIAAVECLLQEYVRIVAVPRIELSRLSNDTALMGALVLARRIAD